MCLCFMVCGTRQARHHKLVERGQKTAAGTEKRNYDSTYELQEVQAQTRAIARRYRNNTCMDCHTQIFIRNPNIDGARHSMIAMFVMMVMMMMMMMMTTSMMTKGATSLPYLEYPHPQ